MKHLVIPLFNPDDLKEGEGSEAGVYRSTEPVAIAIDPSDPQLPSRIKLHEDYPNP